MHQDATLDGRMESVLALVVLLAASSHGKCVCGGGACIQGQCVC